MINASINWSAPLDSSAAGVSPGDCLVSNGTTFVAATAANMSGRSMIGGISLDYGIPNQAARIQVDGTVDRSITGLSAGILAYARLNQTSARIERASTVGASDIIVGVVNELGDVLLSLGAQALPPTKGSFGGIGWLRPEDYGAKGDGVTNDLPAFLACQSAMSTGVPGQVMILGPSTYRLAGNLEIQKQLRITGTTGGGFNGSSVLKFDAGYGVIVHSNTTSPKQANGANGSATSAIFEDMELISTVFGSYRLPSTHYSVGDRVLMPTDLRWYLQCTTAGTTSATVDPFLQVGQTINGSLTDGSVTWKVAVASGFLCLTSCIIRNVAISNFTNSSIFVFGSAGPSWKRPDDGTTVATNANQMRVDYARLSGCGCGVAVLGSDANAGLFTFIDIQGMGFPSFGFPNDDTKHNMHGIWEHSQLGNTWVSPQSTSCWGRNFNADSASNFALFVGLYSESDAKELDLFASAGQQVVCLDAGSFDPQCAAAITRAQGNGGAFNAMFNDLVANPPVRFYPTLCDGRSGFVTAHAWTSDDENSATHNFAMRYEGYGLDRGHYGIVYSGASSNVLETYSGRYSTEGAGWKGSWLGFFEGSVGGGKVFYGTDPISATSQLLRNGQRIVGDSFPTSQTPAVGTFARQKVTTAGWRGAAPWAASTGYNARAFLVSLRSDTIEETISGVKHTFICSASGTSGILAAKPTFSTAAAQYVLGTVGTIAYRWVAGAFPKLGDLIYPPGHSTGRVYAVTAPTYTTNSFVDTRYAYTDGSGRIYRISNAPFVGGVYNFGIVLQPSAGPNGFLYENITPGNNSAGAEPTWPTSDGATVVTGATTWKCHQPKTSVAGVTFKKGNSGSATETASNGGYPITWEHIEIQFGVVTPNWAGSPPVDGYLQLIDAGADNASAYLSDNTAEWVHVGVSPVYASYDRLANAGNTTIHVTGSVVLTADQSHYDCILIDSSSTGPATITLSGLVDGNIYTLQNATGATTFTIAPGAGVGIGPGKIVVFKCIGGLLVTQSTS